MKDMGMVQGHKTQAQPIVIGLDTVYIHTDIRLVDEEHEIYEYKEVQYTLQEYTELMAKDIEKEKKQSSELSQTSDNVLLALAEQFESFNKAQNEILLAIAELYESIQK